MYVQILHKGHISHEALREINGKLKLHQCKFLKKFNEKPRRIEQEKSAEQLEDERVLDEEESTNSSSGFRLVPTLRIASTVTTIHAN
jgi:hypothetical protein